MLRIILKCVLRKMDSSGSVQRSMTGCCESGNGRSDFHKDGKFIDQLCDYQLLKDVSDPWS
jgi:hypothetical protein